MPKNTHEPILYYIQSLLGTNPLLYTILVVINYQRETTMPNFPTYREELPTCLNPRNPRHYLLLAYWVFFRPTTLKSYLYQAAPELYKTGAGLGIFRTLHVRAYRNLYLMVPITALFLSLLLTAPFPLINSFVLDIPVDILEWMLSVAKGVAKGVAFGVAFGVAYGVAGGVAIGVALGVAFGVAGGVAYGVAIGVAFGVTFGIAFGMAVIVAIGVAIGVAFGVAFGMGASRAIFYPVQWIFSLLSVSGKVKHPFFWDELIILPLSDIHYSLNKTLQRDEQQGIIQLADIMSNPFQRWHMQKILYNYWHQHQQPLHFTYNRILNDTSLNNYVFAPLTSRNWERIPNYRQLLLGELAGRWVKVQPDSWTNVSEHLVWWLTKSFREQHSTPLTEFAALLYALYKLDRKKPVDLLNQTEAQTAYTNIKHYPNGEEIRQSFVAFTTFLNYQTIADLTNAPQKVAKLPESNTAIRPTVLKALTHLGDIGAEVATYQQSTSRVNQLAALARAADSLEKLEKTINTDVNEPERYILQAIIEHWQPLITEASGKIGRFAITEPVANPYIAGNPVTGALFVGRDDIFIRLEELWTPEKCPSVILYGHRRMGKTSILKNLGTARFGKHTHIIDFNMQRVGFVKNTGELLYNLALAIYDEMPTNSTLTEPEYGPFTTQTPYNVFERFLKKLGKQRQNMRLLVTVDEFELLELGINEGRFDAHLLEFWRATIQTYPWFIMAFAGLHNLEEMRHDYWHPLFGSFTAIPVTFLTAGATRQLITQPDPDFPLDYDADALDDIIHLTHGQPYLVQLICHSLVSRFNRQTFEQGVETERRFTSTDVKAVIESTDFFRDGNAYFTGIWAQAKTEDNVQYTLLKTLAKAPDGMTRDELAAQTALSNDKINEALRILKYHDVIDNSEEKRVYTVELMRRWVVRQQESKL